MKYNKNSWCPLIRDYCKGDLCVCYIPKNDMTYMEPLNIEAKPYCRYFQAYLPEDKPEDVPAGPCEEWEEWRDGNNNTYVYCPMVKQKLQVTGGCEDGQV